MTFPVSRVFLHFFDTHFFDSRVAANAASIAEARLATRLAVMLAEQVFVPAASYVENAHCKNIVDEFVDLFDDGVIVLVGGEESLRDYSTAKLIQYDEGTDRHAAYLRSLETADVTPAFHSRTRNTTVDIGTGWRYRASDLDRISRGLPDEAAVGRLERAWMDVPDALAHRAFIIDNVTPLLGFDTDQTAGLVLRSRIGTVINDEYFRSFLHELQAAVVTDLVHLDGFEPPPDVPRLPYRELRTALARAGLLKQVFTLSGMRLRDQHDDEAVTKAVMPVFRSMPARTMTSGRLELPLGAVRPAVEKLAKIKTGRKNAKRYAKAVEAIMTALFRFSLDESHWEAEINEGRKRIDILFPNMANAGAFQWAASHYAARVVIVECKNYKNDPVNPELDQLAGRMGTHRSRFGILACRNVRDFDRLMQRCIDFKRDLDLLLVPLRDVDFAELADTGLDPGNAPLGQTLIGRRMLDITKA